MKYVLMLLLIVLAGCETTKLREVRYSDGTSGYVSKGAKADGLHLGSIHIPQSKATKATSTKQMSKVGIVDIEDIVSFIEFTSAIHYTEITHNDWEAIKESFIPVTSGDIVVRYSQDTGEAVIIHEGNVYISDEAFFPQ